MKSLLLMLMTANVVCAGYTATVAWRGGSLSGVRLSALDLPAVRLLAERGSTINISEPAEPAESRARVCSAWGPFESEGDASRFGAELNAARGASVVSDTVEASRGFLVYVSVEDAAANNGVFRRVLADNAVATRVVAAGDLAGAVAVGVFAREGAAEAQARKLKALGVRTRVVPLLETSAAYHVVIADLQGLATRNDLAEECSPIASKERFL